MHQTELHFGSLGGFLYVCMFLFIIDTTLQLAQPLMGIRSDDVHLLRKYGQCFVTYRNDIESIPCPSAEK